MFLNKFINIKLLFFLTLTNLCYGQNFNVFPNTTDTLHFKDPEFYIASVYIDSLVSNSNNQTLFLNSSIEAKSFNNPYCSGNRFSSSLLGNKIIESNNKSLLIFEKDTFVIPKQLDSSSFYFNNDLFKITLKKRDQSLLYNGSLDSVKTFSFTKNGFLITDSILISKNNGLLYWPQWIHGNYYKFSPFYAVERADYNFFNPNDGIGYQVGDELHYKVELNNTTAGGTSTDYDYILNYKVISIDSINNKTRWLKTHKNGTDTIESNLILSDLFFEPKVSVQDYNIDSTGLLSFNMWYIDTIHNFTSACLVQRGSDLINDSCFYHSGFSETEIKYYYLQNVGVLEKKIYHYNHGETSTDKSTLIYYHLGNKSFGNPEYISISEFNNIDFNIFPNPATTHLNVESIQNKNIEVYNLDGVLQFSKQISSNDSLLDISFLKNGVYILFINQISALSFIKL